MIRKVNKLPVWLIGWLSISISIASADVNFLLNEPASAYNEEIQSENCQLTLGWDLVKPYQYYDNSKQVVGFQIELVRAIMNELGCELILYQGQWHTLIDKLKKGEIDFIADMTITENRKTWGFFSEAYRKEYYILYVRKNKINEYEKKSVSELINDGFRLGLTDGFLYSDEIESLKKSDKTKALFKISDSNHQNYQLLADGEIDGLLEDSLVAGYTLREMDIGYLVESLALEVHTGDISYMFSKKSVSQSQVKAFNQALRKVKLTDEYKKFWISAIN